MPILAALTYPLISTGGELRPLNRPPGPPVDTNGATNEVNEGTTLGTPVGITAQSSDPDGDVVSYSLTNDAGGRFRIDANTGGGACRGWPVARWTRLTHDHGPGRRSVGRNFDHRFHDPGAQRRTVAESLRLRRD